MLAGYVENNSLASQDLLNTKEQYMKESNTLAGYVEKNSPASHIVVNTKRKSTQNHVHPKDKD